MVSKKKNKVKNRHVNTHALDRYPSYRSISVGFHHTSQACIAVGVDGAGRNFGIALADITRLFGRLQNVLRPISAVGLERVRGAVDALLSQKRGPVAKSGTVRTVGKS